MTAESLLLCGTGGDVATKGSGKRSAESQRASALCTVLWSLARLGIEPSAGWLEAAASAAEPLAPHARPKELAMLVWSFSKMRPTLASGQRLASVVVVPLLMGDGGSALGDARGQQGPRGGFRCRLRPAEACMLFAGFAELCCAPPRPLLSALLQRTAELALARRLRAQEVVSLLRSAVVLVGNSLDVGPTEEPSLAPRAGMAEESSGPPPPPGQPSSWGDGQPEIPYHLWLRRVFVPQLIFQLLLWRKPWPYAPSPGMPLSTFRSTELIKVRGF